MSTPVVVEICSWISELLGRAVLAPDGAPSRADGLEKGRHALALRIGPGSGDVQPAVIVRASAQRDRVVSGFRSRGALSASPGSPGSRPPPADKPGEEGVGQVLDAQRTLERVVVGDRHVAHPAQAADAIDTLRLRERLPEAGPAEGVVAAVRREDRMNVEIAARGRRPSDRIHAPGLRAGPDDLHGAQAGITAASPELLDLAPKRSTLRHNRAAQTEIARSLLAAFSAAIL
jgi:hypothetical protein